MQTQASAAHFQPIQRECLGRRWRGKVVFGILVWDWGFFPLPSGKDVEGSAFLWKSVHGSQWPVKPGWAVACTASTAEFLPRWTCPLPPFPLPLSLPPSRLPTLQVCVSKESSPVRALSAGREQAVCWKACVSWVKAVLFLLHFFSALERYFYLLITKVRLNNWEYV